MIARIALAALGVAFAAPASADVRSTPPQHSTCIAPAAGPSRVMATPLPQNCCYPGELRCSQFLSTTAIVRPGGAFRT